MATRFFGDTNFKIKIQRGVNMERFKRFWVVASSLMLVLALVTVLGTKPVHALVAAMVQVANTAANPIPVTGAVRDLDNPARSPFLFRCNDRNCSFDVPAGKRLVVENIFGTATMPPGEKPLIQLNGIVSVGGDLGGYAMIVPAVFRNNFLNMDFYQINFLTRIYADHAFGGEVKVGLFSEPDSNTGIMELFVSGYLVNLP